jgi:mRNA-degrading endonuclease toxin of MazEF toxin-antitoxin module
MGEGGLHNESWVKCDQPTTVEKQLLVYPPLGTLSAESMRTVEVAVKAALELP